MEKSIVPLVEEFSEVESVPILLRRLRDENGLYRINIAKPFRVMRTRVVREGELERALNTALQTRPGCAAFLAGCR